MDVGIGLPTTVPGTEGKTLVEWARRAEEAGFSTLGKGGPELIIGGHDEAAFRRAARLGDGWIMGGGPPEMFAQLAGAVDRAWRAAGRSGTPRKLSLAYFALGPRAREQADSYMKHYYGWLGEFANQIATGAAVSEEMVKGYVAAFEQSGCDELILIPSSSKLDQVALLAEAVR